MMKKISKLFVLMVFLVVPAGVHAGGIGSSALLGLILEKLTVTEIGQAAYFVKNLIDTAATVKNTYDQVEKMIESEKRAINNLKGILNVDSFGDFMTWTNRQLYLNRESEARFQNLGVKIGRHNYKVADIDKIPDAMRNEFGDKYWDDFTDEQRRDMWVSLGLSPGNYMYLKTWEERNDKIAKKILTYSDIFSEEHEEANARNAELISKYSTENEKLDANEISKDANLIAMNQEMLLRELIRLQIEMHEYQLSRDKMNEPSFNPPRLSETWGYDPYQAITSAGYHQDEYTDY